MFCWMNVDPWHDISMVSSPVYELGARNMVTSVWSIGSPRRVEIVPRWAVCEVALSSDFPVQSFCTVCIACGPEILMVAIAPVPGGVAMAAMVSVMISVGFMVQS